MTAATVPGLDTAPTKHQGLLAWVAEVAELTQPDQDDRGRDEHVDQRARRACGFGPVRSGGRRGFSAHRQPVRPTRGSDQGPRSNGSARARTPHRDFRTRPAVPRPG